MNSQESIADDLNAVIPSFERWVYVFALASAVAAIAQAIALEPRWGAASSLGTMVVVWAIRGLIGPAR